MTDPIDLLLWGAAPYVSLAVLAGGLVWRYRHDRFGWTSRSTQLYESRLLRVGSPLFHLGLLLVAGGHVLGLAVPKALTELAGVDEHTYHLVSLGMGTVAGLLTAAGLAVLLYRRLTVPRVRRATTLDDRLVYPVLGLVLLLGLTATIVDNGIGGGYDYRETVAPWLRHLFLLDPRPELMAGVPLDFRLHVLLAMVLFALVPFSRLVHAFSAPVHYLFRPYLVYRRRAPEVLGTRAQPRGWAP
ncbi:respiratory nitrate reductase subunit gamma [Nocardiopsis potens]|uniref:respiratory nitrate reductase subunit gamma n=1 Tax=Nocardiopsis potens TaxID=1246458 RepID=UPI000347C4F1|nr:respiratory nitrate reductase subunit gamma [Nocardiopsis potens]